MKRLQGVITFKDIGRGTWEFLSKDGQRYEIVGGDESLYQDGQQVTIRGNILKDAMSAGNIGPIFEVQSIED
ncbi:hypothetical protein CSA56_14880 [candidate division KSB3 bacterium]|uniref:DUF5666 domain-containing protein n=1 Tax=candidate division KSB3 bacterium TaxID=2044937 RepID=A0A2G6KA68_9BACT|nr:MAG: hypothetical protein CSA56_14880 [candidate division KSB3 bacterium]